ncbi:MAG TPA: hypothetical protein VMD55_06395 [Terracidiphilus sp.]|nr:hypothetical protein [Terracidiphilus sp.]
MRIPGYFGSRFIACAGWALLVCAISIAGAREAKAQSNNDAFFGYSRLGSNLFRSGTPGLNGWEGDLHIHVKPFVGVEGDLAHYGVGASRSTARSTTVLFGPRVTLKAAGFHLFAHAMIGGEHTSSSTTYAYALGGGVDVPIRLMFAWRVQADRISAPTASPSNATHARFTTGLVFRF